MNRTAMLVTSQQSIPESCASTTQSQPFWLLLGTAVALYFVSFICEQNIYISTQFAYTQTLEEMTSTAEGGNTLRRLTFLSLGCGGVGLFLASLKRPWSFDPILTLALLMLPAWCCASLLWSIDSGMCVRRLIVMLCCFAAAVGIGRSFSLRELCQIGFFVALATAVTGVLAEVALGTFRPWSGEYRFSGSLHPNTQGIFLALLVFSSFTLARTTDRYKVWYLACCAMGLVLLVLTKSRTATAAVMLALGSLCLMQTNWRWQVVAGSAVAWCAGVLTLLTLSAGINSQDELKRALLLGREEQTESFNGRGEIWPVVLSFIEQRSIAGHGFESFWTPKHIAYISNVVEWPVREAHNGYLEVLLHLGWVGLILGLVLVGWSWLRAMHGFATSGDPYFAFVGSVLVFGLLDSTMESGMVVAQSVVLVAVACMVQLATGLRGRSITRVAQSNPRSIKTSRSAFYPSMNRQV